MADNYVLAVAVTIVFHDADFSREGGANGITDINLDVKTAVVASPASSEVTGDDATGGRHVETTQVYLVLVGQGCLFVGVSVVPIVIEVRRGVV